MADAGRFVKGGRGKGCDFVWIGVGGWVRARGEAGSCGLHGLDGLLWGWVVRAGCGLSVLCCDGLAVGAVEGGLIFEGFGGVVGVFGEEVGEGVGWEGVGDLPRFG